MSSASDVAAKMTPNINDEAWMLVNKLLLDKVVIGEIGYVGKHSDQQIIRISRQYVYTLEDAAVNNNPLLLFMFDEGKDMITGDGHANVLVIKKVPAAAEGAAGGAAEGVAGGTAEQYIATLYDNHMQDNHAYSIKDIRIMVQKMQIPMVETIQAKVTAWVNNLTYLATNIFKMDTTMFTNWYSTTGKSTDDIPEIQEAVTAPEKDMAFCFDVDRTVYTGLQKRYPNEGICLWSALIIYLELLEKKKKGDMKLKPEELDVIFTQNPARKLRSIPLGPHAYFQKLYDLVLKPQIADIYEDFKGTQSVNVAAVAGATGGGGSANPAPTMPLLPSAVVDKRSAPHPARTISRWQRASTAPLGGKRKTRRSRKKGRVRKTKRKRKTRRRTKRRKRNYSK
jgi:hypothetical protein